MNTQVTTNHELHSFDFVVAYNRPALPARKANGHQPLEANIRVLRIASTGRLELTELVRALTSGADGVLVVGQRPAYGRDEREIERRFAAAGDLLEFVGYGRERARLVWTDGSDRAYRQAVAEFAESIQAARPVIAPLASLDGAATISRMTGTHAPAGVNIQFRALAASLLAEGGVSGVLGWAQATDEIVPFLARTPGEVHRLFAGGEGYPSLAAVVQAYAGERVAVVARPADLRAIEELWAEGKLRREDVLLIGQGVPAAECDQVLVEGRGNDAAALQTSELAALEQWPREQRAAFWRGQFENCVGCDACRSACPFRCYAGCMDALSAASPAQALDAGLTAACHLSCALRLGTRCVLCESCSAACPQGVPLHLLHQRVAKSLA